MPGRISRRRECGGGRAPGRGRCRRGRASCPPPPEAGAATWSSGAWANTPRTQQLIRGGGARRAWRPRIGSVRCGAGVARLATGLGLRVRVGVRTRVRAAITRTRWWVGIVRSLAVALSASGSGGGGWRRAARRHQPSKGLPFEWNRGRGKEASVFILARCSGRPGGGCAVVLHCSGPVATGKPTSPPGAVRAVSCSLQMFLWNGDRY